MHAQWPLRLQAWLTPKRRAVLVLLMAVAAAGGAVLSARSAWSSTGAWGQFAVAAAAAAGTGAGLFYVHHSWQRLSVLSLDPEQTLARVRKAAPRTRTWALTGWVALLAIGDLAGQQVEATALAATAVFAAVGLSGFALALWRRGGQEPAPPAD